MFRYTVLAQVFQTPVVLLVIFPLLPRDLIILKQKNLPKNLEQLFP